MESIKLALSIPFRLDGTPQAFPGEVFHFNPAVKRAYLQALHTELTAAAADFAESEVTWLELSAGFVFLEYDQLQELLQHIRAQFRVAADVVVTGCCEPGRISTGVLNFCKNAKMQDLTLLYRCADPAWQQARGLLPAGIELEHSRSVFEHSMFRHYSLLLDAEGQTEAQWKRTLHDAAASIPQSIRLQNADAAALEQAARLLPELGYHPAEPTQFLYKDAKPLPPQPATVLGCGLGAESRMDGLRCRNTTDLEQYLRHSGQIELIAQVME